MNVFVDTNILLQLYEASQADLAEVRKLLTLAENGGVTLLVSPQVRDEFIKHREETIADALKLLTRQTLKIEVPNLYTGLPHRDELVSGVRALEEVRRKLLNEAKAIVESDALEADKVVREFISQAGSEGPSEALVNKARLRVDRGNPPGKKGYGDAINWEWLIGKVQRDSDIHIVTFDNDFKSAIDRRRPAEFLSSEWRRRVGGEVYVYESLYEFFASKFPVLLQVENIDKHLAIEALATSPNFRSTHSAVARLNRFESFNSAERGELLRAIVENGQVNRIISDPDVRAFTVSLLNSLEAGEHDELAEVVLLLLNPPSPEEEAVDWLVPDFVLEPEDLPF